jgi:hypothetical protein
MKRGEIRRAIMVVTDNLTPFAKSCLGEIASKGYLIEVFQVSLHSASGFFGFFSAPLSCCTLLDLSGPDSLETGPRRGVLRRAGLQASFV